MSQDLTPYREPVPPAAPTAPPAETGVPLAYRVAGVALIVNAVYVLAEAALGVGTFGARAPGMMIGSAVVDVVLAWALLQGSERVRTWILFRIGAGFILSFVTGAASSDWATVAMQAAYAAAVFGLLVGRPGRARLVASLLLVGLCFAGEALGLLVLSGALDRPLASLAAQSPEYVHPNPREVRGVRGSYRLPLPPAWIAHTQASAHAANELNDQWITNPAHDAHVLVIAETIAPDHVADAALVLRTMIDRIRGSGTDARELPHRELAGHPGVPFAEIEVTLSPDGGGASQRLRYRLAAFVAGPQMVQLIGFADARAPARTWQGVSDAMRGFELLPFEGLPNNAGGADGQDHVAAVPGGVLRGRAFDYTMRVAPGWYLRNQAEAAAELATADRWLVVPYSYGTLYVTGERAEAGIVFDHQMYVREFRRVVGPGVTVWRGEEALHLTAGEGTLVRYDAVDEGVRRRWIVGLVTTQTEAYSVVGSSTVEHYAEFEDAMREMISSFVPGGANPAGR